MVRKDVHQSVNTAEDDGKVTEARASRQEQISVSRGGFLQDTAIRA